MSGWTRKTKHSTGPVYKGQHRFEHWYRDNQVYFLTASWVGGQVGERSAAGTPRGRSGETPAIKTTLTAASAMRSNAGWRIVTR